MHALLGAIAFSAILTGTSQLGQWWNPWWSDQPYGTGSYYVYQQPRLTFSGQPYSYQYTGGGYEVAPRLSYSQAPPSYSPLWGNLVGLPQYQSNWLLR